ncbi:DUF1014-domain-containing protein [Trichodelitschia bisporula]|uniref:DUF1014-domain-containing protein n=1 Tax=Trichodelitschia bisporula TaxID=703511 RepID=A0A6G1HX73_9PEZI|nr:DUF1014-domain-containing protein [Trichodelitschia bisporula]
MAGKKTAGENSKKASGQARKAEAAAAKVASKDREVGTREEAEWNKGAKDTSKKEAAAAKAAEAARKKAEKAALAAEEEASLPSKPKGNAKVAVKKNQNRGLDLAQLDAPEASGKSAATSLNATGIDNALDALSLTGSANDSVDRHPERRFPAAYKAYEERRLEEMKDEKGLRRQQRIELIRKEFEKHPDNPYNQVAGRFNSTKDELAQLREVERLKVERRLAGDVS